MSSSVTALEGKVPTTRFTPGLYTAGSRSTVHPWRKSRVEDIANSTVAGALSSLPYAFHTTSRYEPIVVPLATTGSGTSTPVGLASSAPLATLVPSSFFHA